jgi:hypothetical protein
MSTADVRASLEALVTTYVQPVSPSGKRNYNAGLVDGERNTVLMVLKARGLQASDSHRDQVSACADLEQLREWAETALTAKTANDVFQ